MTRRRSKGEGTIFQNKQGLWVARITLPDGKRKQKTSKSQGIVRKWLIDRRKALADGMLVEQDNILFSQFIDRYFNDVAVHTLRPKTLQAYEYLIRKHIKPEIGYMKLSKLRPDHLQSLYGKKLNEGLSKRTVQFIHAVINKSLKYALRWNLIVRNPCDLVDAPRPTKKPPIILSQKEIEIFLNSLTNHRWYALYYLAIATAMRECELLGLKWEDVDLENKTLQVKRQLQYIVGEGLIFTEPKSDSSLRLLSIPEKAIKVLYMHSEKQQAIKDLAGNRWEEYGLVFTTNIGTPINPRNLLRHFHSSLADINLPRMKFHALRHTTPSLLLSKNKHPKLVQMLLGHSEIGLTLNTYSHATPQMQGEIADAIDEILP